MLTTPRHPPPRLRRVGSVCGGRGLGGTGGGSRGSYGDGRRGHGGCERRQREGGHAGGPHGGDQARDGGAALIKPLAADAVGGLFVWQY